MSVYDLSVTDALLSTTRAVRKRLDFDKPVPRQIVCDCLELALQAPTGSNRQGWRWIVVTDADTRMALADLYRKGAGAYLEDAYREASARGAVQDSRVFDSARYLAERLQDAPVHVVPCIVADHIPADAPRRAPHCAPHRALRRAPCRSSPYPAPLSVCRRRCTHRGS